MQKHTHHLFLMWLILTGVVCFLSVLAWMEGLLYVLISTDRSKISLGILLVYFCVTIHCAIRFFYVSSQINYFNYVSALVTQQKDFLLSISDKRVILNGQTLRADRIITSYLHDWIKQQVVVQDKVDASTVVSSDNIDYYEVRLKAPNDMGWFVADLMIKMGLLGTIVGFIFMLASVSNISNFDITSMQKVLAHMSSGMAIALYTTLAGLICSILSAIQYQILDGNSDVLISSIKNLIKIQLQPKFYSTGSETVAVDTKQSGFFKRLMGKF